MPRLTLSNIVNHFSAIEKCFLQKIANFFKSHLAGHTAVRTTRRKSRQPPAITPSSAEKATSAVRLNAAK